MRRADKGALKGKHVDPSPTYYFNDTYSGWSISVFLNTISSKTCKDRRWQLLRQESWRTNGLNIYCNSKPEVHLMISLLSPHLYMGTGQQSRHNIFINLLESTSFRRLPPTLVHKVKQVFQTENKKSAATKVQTRATNSHKQRKRHNH